MGIIEAIGGYCTWYNDSYGDETSQTKVNWRMKLISNSMEMKTTIGYMNLKCMKTVNAAVDEQHW